jgi:putative transposase
MPSPGGTTAVSHSYSTNLIHLVFSTKDRMKLITSELQKPLWDDFVGIGRNQNIPVLSVGGMSDHMHILYGLPATMTLANSVQILKANSSRFMGEHGIKFAWQEGYGAFGVSESNRSAVMRYIANQAEHHQKRSFEEEFIAFLKRHKVEYDPRYVFG